MVRCNKDYYCVMDAISPEQCRAARALLGWTQEQLSDASGVPMRTVNNFESAATSPRASTTLLLVKAFRDAGVVFVSVLDAPGGVIRLR
jgi:transcriptional regulator with XRE-family HTH domain